MIPHLTPHELADAVQTILGCGFVVLAGVQFALYWRERKWLEEALRGADAANKRWREAYARLFDERRAELEVFDRRLAALVKEFHPDVHPLADASDVASRLTLLRGAIRVARDRQ